MVLALFVNEEIPKDYFYIHMEKEVYIVSEMKGQLCLYLTVYDWTDKLVFFFSDL